MRLFILHMISSSFELRMYALVHPENAAPFILPVRVCIVISSHPSVVYYLRMRYLSARYVECFEERNGFLRKVREKVKMKEDAIRNGRTSFKF